LFEARQKRFTFDGEHFFVDLVFYNRLLQYFISKAKKQKYEQNFK
jgi:predicted nuclease of restriction endonuclease-like (RecB) superfamily